MLSVFTGPSGWKLWRSANGTREETKSKECYILKLPSDVLEEIIRIHLAQTRCNHYARAIATLSLVHRSWLPIARYLAYVKVSFIPKTAEHAKRMFAHLKARLPPPPLSTSQVNDFVPGEQKEHAACRTLLIRLVNTEERLHEAVGLDLFHVLGHSIWTLEIHGLAGMFWSPGNALIAVSRNTPFLPNLRQLKAMDVGTWTLMAYLVAIWKGDGKLGPSGLVIHHDFELSRERDRLSLPIEDIAILDYPWHQAHWTLNAGEKVWVTAALPELAKMAPADPSIKQEHRRPPLDVYISRRLYVAEFLQNLGQAKILMAILKQSIQSVDFWLKDEGEVGPEIESVIQSAGWECFIERDVADGDTTPSLLHEF